MISVPEKNSKQQKSYNSKNCACSNDEPKMLKEGYKNDPDKLSRYILNILLIITNKARDSALSTVLF